MNEATVSEQWNYKLPLKVEFAEVEALELEVQLNSEFLFCWLLKLCLFGFPVFFVCALHATPRSGIDENDVADLIFEHLLLAEDEYPVVIAV